MWQLAIIFWLEQVIQQAAENDMRGGQSFCAYHFGGTN